jgi:hypothetical protein
MYFYVIKRILDHDEAVLSDISKFALAVQSLKATKSAAANALLYRIDPSASNGGFESASFCPAQRPKSSTISLLGMNVLSVLSSLHRFLQRRHNNLLEA